MRASLWVSEARFLGHGDGRVKPWGLAASRPAGSARAALPAKSGATYDRARRPWLGATPWRIKRVLDAPRSRVGAVQVAVLRGDYQVAVEFDSLVGFALYHGLGSFQYGCGLGGGDDDDAVAVSDDDVSG